ALALVAEAALVRVVVCVTALGRARRRRLGELARRVAVLALVLQVLALEREALHLALGIVGERLVVIELERVPRTRAVARLAVLAERALVQRVLVALAARVAVGRNLVERRLAALVATGVAIAARHALVALDERE